MNPIIFRLFECIFKKNEEFVFILETDRKLYTMCVAVHGYGIWLYSWENNK